MNISKMLEGNLKPDEAHSLAEFLAIKSANDIEDSDREKVLDYLHSAILHQEMYPATREKLTTLVAQLRGYD